MSGITKDPHDGDGVKANAGAKAPQWWGATTSYCDMNDIKESPSAASAASADRLAVRPPQLLQHP